MDYTSLIISLITGITAVTVAVLTSRNKATQSSVDALRAELRECKETNDRDREAERVIRDDIVRQLKEALEEKNRLFDQNLKLMQKLLLLDTNPNIKK